MYKHWEKIALALTAFFWNGCDDSSSTPNDCALCEYEVDVPQESSSSTIPSPSSSSKEPITCMLSTMIFDTIECGHNTTTYNYFDCDDGFECSYTPECDSKIYCSDKKGQNISYTKEEFYTKYSTQNGYCEKLASGEKICILSHH